MKKTILDLNGEPFCFFRGYKSNHGKIGTFYTNCYEEAKGFSTDGRVIKCSIRVSNPLIIDATRSNGYDSYNGIEIKEIKLYPESARAGLLKFASCDERTTLSTDDIITFVKKRHKFDSVIIKNIREGICNLPVYVIMITSERCVFDINEIIHSDDDYNKWTFKRIRLGDFITSCDFDTYEVDGLLCRRFFNHFYVEDYIELSSDGSYIINQKYTFITKHKKIKIKTLLLNGYIKGDFERNGHYKCDLLTQNDIFEAVNGKVTLSCVPIELPLLKEDSFIIENLD